MYKRIIGVLMAVALLLTIIGAALYTQSPAGEEPFPRVIAMVPDWSGFVEDADTWNFGAVLVTPSTEALEASFVGAQIGGQFVTSLNEVEWTEVVRVSMQVEDLLAQYEKLHELAVGQLARPDGRVATDIAEKYWGTRTKIRKVLAEEAKEIGAIQLIIPSMRVNPGETEVVELIFEVRKKNDPTKWQQITALTSVSNLVFPPGGVEDNSVWIRGDLHIHSIYSDGNQNLYKLRDSVPNLKGRGYHFVYMADHVGYQVGDNLQRLVCVCPTGPGYPAACNAASTWRCYVTNTQRVTQPEIAFFPGAEYSTWAGGALSRGHALIYGLNSLVRTDGHLLFDGDLSGPGLVLRSPGTSLAIAHPVHSALWMNWNWGIRSYHGVELMTPFDWNHSLSSGETQWWLERAFTTQALADAVSGLPVLSVRTGSDFHGKRGEPYAQFYTHVLIPSTFTDWKNAPWPTRRQHVDGGLSAGRSIASYRGGWGRVAVNGVLPGGVLRNIAANTVINFQVRFIPARTGTYTIYVFRNNLTTTPVNMETLSGTAGVEITRTFTQNFPGGDQGYWFYVEGADHVYSTPIVVTSQP